MWAKCIKYCNMWRNITNALKTIYDKMCGTCGPSAKTLFVPTPSINGRLDGTSTLNSKTPRQLSMTRAAIRDLRQTNAQGTLEAETPFFLPQLRLLCRGSAPLRSVFKISCLFLRPRPWQFEIWDSTDTQATYLFSWFETLNLNFCDLKLWKLTVQRQLDPKDNVTLITAPRAPGPRKFKGRATRPDFCRTNEGRAPDLPTKVVPTKIHWLRLSGKFPPWTREFHPSESRFCLSQTLWNPASPYGDWPYTLLFWRTCGKAELRSVSIISIFEISIWESQIRTN